MAATALRPTPQALDLRGVRDRLNRALALLPADSPAVVELSEALHALGGDEFLRVGTAAEMLGVASKDTVKNWAKAGRFPGARKTEGGQWLFPLEEVLAHRANSLVLARRKFAAGHVATGRVDVDPFQTLQVDDKKA